MCHFRKRVNGKKKPKTQKLFYIPSKRKYIFSARAAAKSSSFIWNRLLHETLQHMFSVEYFVVLFAHPLTSFERDPNTASIWIPSSRNHLYHRQNTHSSRWVIEILWKKVLLMSAPRGHSLFSDLITGYLSGNIVLIIRYRVQGYWDLWQSSRVTIIRRGKSEIWFDCET